jgi:hypothetical protein
MGFFLSDAYKFRPIAAVRGLSEERDSVYFRFGESPYPLFISSISNLLVLGCIHRIVQRSGHEIQVVAGHFADTESLVALKDW